MKTLLILLISAISLFSFDVLSVKAEILSKIAKELVKKDVVNIYVDDEDLIKTKGLVPSLNYTTCKEADVLFISNKDKLDKVCKDKYIFSTSYYLYQNSQEVIGAFFWQKGRPNIIIKSAMIEKLEITLSKPFQKYVE